MGMTVGARAIIRGDDASNSAAEYGGWVAVRASIERWGDWALALVLVLGIEFEIWFAAPAGLEVRGGRAVVVVLGVLMVLPVAWRRHAPTVVLATMTGAFATCMLVISHSRGAPTALVIALVSAFYTVGAHTSGRRSVAAVVVGVATIASIDLLGGGVFQAAGGARPGAWALFAVAWQLGREVQRRRLEVRGLRARAADLERDREEKLRVASAEERARIARELHDVVAHSVSVIVVQAQAAERVLAGDEPATRELLESIETTGRQALTELRWLLGLLRQVDGEPSLAPLPSLRYLDDLVNQVRDAGLPVELVVDGVPTALPQGIDLSAYRIVQEGLTNALKHAGKARARVVVRYTAAELQLEVTDDGKGDDNGATATGQGLVGMRERVALYGGELRTGRRGEGGYFVHARLPLGSKA